MKNMEKGFSSVPMGTNAKVHRSLQQVRLLLTTELGQWREDQKTGQGVYTFKNGNKYEGKFENNMFHGNFPIIDGF